MELATRLSYCDLFTGGRSAADRQENRWLLGGPGRAEGSMRLAIRLFVLTVLWGATGLAQGTVQPTLNGVWKVTEIVVTGAGAYSVSTPEPSLFIFAKTHYSLMWVRSRRFARWPTSSQ